MGAGRLDTKDEMENPRRILRRKGRPTHKVSQRSKNRSPIRKRARKHRSLEPSSEGLSQTVLGRPRPSTSTCSIRSVVYLGYYRKVPQLITLDDTTEQDQNQSLTEASEGVSTSSTKSEYEDLGISNFQLDNSFTARNTTANLLDLLRGMYVDPGHDRTLVYALSHEH